MKRPEAEGTYQAIYRVVAEIPEGRVATYGQVAALAGLPGHARQVGYALHALSGGSDGVDGANVPWQRVINARGEVSLRSPSDGPGREGYQRHLLEEEGVEFDLAGRVDLGRFAWEPSRLPRTRQAGASRGKTGPLVREIEKLLLPLGTAGRAEGAKAYLKSDLRFWGIDTPTMRRAARAWLKERKGFTRKDLTDLVEALWRRPVHELRHFAIETLFVHQALLEAEDLPLLEGLLRRSGTWAYVDAIAVQVVGPLVERHPQLHRRLDAWARDSDFWIRRSALLALLRPLRRGAGEWERFTRYADRLLEEREFFIRKAIGWVLREVGKVQPARVRDYLAPRLDRIAGLTLREAVKFLPARQRSRLLASYAARRSDKPPAGASRRSAIDERRKG